MPKKPMRKWHSFSLLRNKPLLHRIATELPIRPLHRRRFSRHKRARMGSFFPHGRAFYDFVIPTC